MIFGLPAYIFWLAAGLACIGLSYLIPTPGLTAAGLAGLLTGLLALVIPSVAAQIIVWGAIAVALTLVLQRWLYDNQRFAKGLQPDTEAKVIVRIPANGVGRVAYEASRWKARCVQPGISIEPEQTVRVVGRKRNTLLVLPLDAT